MKKILNLIFVLALALIVGLPAISSAQTSPFTLVSQNVTTGSSGSAIGTMIPSFCVDIPVSLSSGSRSSFVSSLQAYLHAQGFLTVGATGFYGSLTAQAVMNFQKSHGISQTGTVGPLTRAALKSASCGGSQGTDLITVSSPMDGQSVVRGSMLNIAWQAFVPRTFAAGPLPRNPASYNIMVAPVAPSCPIGYACPLMMIKPYTIATNVSAQGNYSISFPWRVGNNLEGDRTITDGKYRVQICTVSNDASICGTSGIFTLVTDATLLPPTITSLSTTSGAVGTTVTVHGTGFTGIGNTIHFGNGVIMNISTPVSDTLNFTVPSSINPACLYSTPACMIASMMTSPGDYSVSVSNSKGTSNAMNFHVPGPSWTSSPNGTQPVSTGSPQAAPVSVSSGTLQGVVSAVPYCPGGHCSATATTNYTKFGIKIYKDYVTLVKQLKFNADHTFSVALDPGIYTIQPDFYGTDVGLSGTWNSNLPQTVTIYSGNSTTFNINLNYIQY